MSDAARLPVTYRGLDTSLLRKRELDGSYPFRTHRTCAEWLAPQQRGVA